MLYDKRKMGGSSMIWKRQEYISHCQYEFTGREMFCELFGPLAPLEEEWR